MDKLFLAIVKKREQIITGFKILFGVLVLLTLLGGRSMYYRDASATFFLDVGYWAGRIAIIFYITTMLPGIARRFGIQHKLFNILMIFRRYIGISMYLLTLAHFWIMEGVSWFLRGHFTLTPPWFEFFGVIAHCILFLLAVTSNDIATKKLGSWWNRLHSLTYLVVVLIFLHVALVEVGLWTIIIGVAMLLQGASFAFTWKKKADIQAKKPSLDDILSTPSSPALPTSPTPPAHPAENPPPPTETKAS